MMNPAAKAPSTMSRSNRAEMAVSPMSIRFTVRTSIWELVLAFSTTKR